MAAHVRCAGTRYNTRLYERHEKSCGLHLRNKPVYILGGIDHSKLGLCEFFKPLQQSRRICRSLCSNVVAFCRCRDQIRSSILGRSRGLMLLCKGM